MSDHNYGHRLVLASSSPRRRELLASVGIVPAIIASPDIDETVQKNERPRLYVRRMAGEKAARIRRDHKDCFILAADTVIVRGRHLLRCPENADQATAFLERLSGCRHTVISGVCLIHPDGQIRHRRAETAVLFKRLDRRDIRAAINGGEWRDKAGGYAAQGIAGRFIRRINGSWSNIIGLPLYETCALLDGSGAPCPPGA